MVTIETGARGNKSEHFQKIRPLFFVERNGTSFASVLRSLCYELITLLLNGIFIVDLTPSSQSSPRYQSLLCRIELPAHVARANRESPHSQEATRLRPSTARANLLGQARSLGNGARGRESSRHSATFVESFSLKFKEIKEKTVRHFEASAEFSQKHHPLMSLPAPLIASPSTGFLSP